MEWQRWGEQLKEVLELQKSPVAMTYTDEPPVEVTGKYRACSALRAASGGQTVVLCATNSTCPGGSTFLGLRLPPPEQGKVLREFLIKGEKIFASPAALHRASALTKAKPPFGTADYVVFAPLEGAELKPDVAIFTCNAWQAARLIGLAYYRDGMPMECDPIGALCRSVMTYPFVTGKVNVSFGDITARKSEHIPADELFISLPYPHLQSVVESIAGCSCGTAKVEFPPAMRELIRRSGGEASEE